MYQIPLDTSSGTRVPVYKPSVAGGYYIYHYDDRYLYIIQKKPAPHFHKDDVAVRVTKLSKDEVENCDNIVSKYT